MSLESKIQELAEGIGTDINNLKSFLPPVHIGGRFLLDPNEFNGWGVVGYVDDTNTQDLGNVGAAVNRLAGGLMFPFDVRLISFKCWHRNSNNTALPWGWRIVRQAKVAGSNTVTSVDILRECTGTGATAIAPRNYLNNQNQQTDIDLRGTDVIPSGEVITLGVESPTATTTNYYVDVMSGCLLFERV